MDGLADASWALLQLEFNGLVLRGILTSGGYSQARWSTRL